MIHQWFKTTHVSSLIVAVGPESRCDRAASSGSLMRPQSRCHLGLGSHLKARLGKDPPPTSRGLSAGVSSSQVARLRTSVPRWAFSWKPPSVLCRIGLSVEHLTHGSSLHQNRQGGESTVKAAARAVCNVFMEATPHHIRCIGHSRSGEAGPVGGIH